MATKLNALRSPPDTRDWVFEKYMAMFPKTAFPEALDWRPHMPPVRNQGAEGSCVAHAGAAIKEFHERMNYGFTGYMSPEFIFSCRSNRPGYGMYLRDCCNVLRKFGTCFESTFKYSDDNVERDAPGAALQEATNHRISGYAFVMTCEGMKQALAATGPVLLNVAVYNGNGTKIWRPNGAITGWHAMIAVGYNAEGFIIRNSWGTWWGDAGHEVIPYSDFQHIAEKYAMWDDLSSKKLSTIDINGLLPRGHALLADEADFAGNIMTFTKQHNTLDNTGRYFTLKMDDAAMALLVGPRSRMTVFTNKACSGEREIYFNDKSSSNMKVVLPPKWQRTISSCRVDTAKTDNDACIEFTVTSCVDGSVCTRIDSDNSNIKKLISAGGKTSRFITIDGRSHQIMGMTGTYLLISPKHLVPKGTHKVVVHPM
jgi:hypothetical protein